MTIYSHHATEDEVVIDRQVALEPVPRTWIHSVPMQMKQFKQSPRQSVLTGFWDLPFCGILGHFGYFYPPLLAPTNSNSQIDILLICSFCS